MTKPFVAEMYDSRHRANKTVVEDELYKTAFEAGVVSNVLILVGTDYIRHTEQAFKYIARPFRGKHRSKIIIIENDSNMTGTYAHLILERAKALETDPRHKNVRIFNEDIMAWPTSYRFEDLDFCGTISSNGNDILTRFKDQIVTYQKPKYNKALIFTICERSGDGKAGRDNSFRFLQKMLGFLGADLIGMNGVEGKWMKVEAARQLGLPTGKTYGGVKAQKGKHHYTYYAREAKPMFSRKGDKLKEFRVFSYQDKNHEGKLTSPMVTGILIYR